MIIISRYQYSFFASILAICACGHNPVLVSSDAADDLEPVEEGFVDQADAGPCLSDEDCSNGLLCDGEETCLDGLCMPGEAVQCDDGNDCTDDFCSEEEPGCVFLTRDRDGDGFGDAACGGTDCDDSRDDVYPGAPGSCNEGEDLNCTGTPDFDDDQDGYVDADCPGGDDCDDHDPDTFPGASEICLDGKDQDCDGIVDGPMLMTPNVKISEWGSGGSTRAIVWTGSEFGIAYDGWSYEIYFVRVNAAGIVIQDETVITETGDSLKTDAAWTGSEIAIVYRSHKTEYTSDIYYTRLTAQGIKIGDETRLTYVDSPTDGLYPSIAWTGSVFGLSWYRYTQDHSEWFDYVYFKEFDLSGADASDEIIVNPYEDGINPQLEWTGTEFGVAWNCNDICYTRISSEGTLLTDPIRLTSLTYSMFHFPRIEWTGTEIGLLWYDRLVEGGTSQVYFSRVSPEGVKDDDDLMLSDPTQYSINPRMAWTGSEYGVVWVGSLVCCEDVNLMLFFDRVSAEGDEIHNEIALTNANQGDFSPVDIVWTGSEFGVVWVWTPGDWRNGTYFNRIGFCD